MEQIHNLKKRMPLILSKEDEKKWIEPYPESDMISYTVSQKVNSGKNNRNVPQSMEKADYPELSLLSI